MCICVSSGLLDAWLTLGFGNNEKKKQLKIAVFLITTIYDNNIIMVIPNSFYNIMTLKQHKETQKIVYPTIHSDFMFLLKDKGVHVVWH